jgi:DNA-directed RNA polymerase subunit H (RpoH/RPB5)
MNRSDIEDTVLILNAIGLNARQISRLSVDDVVASKETVLIGDVLILNFQTVFHLLRYSRLRSQSATCLDDPFIPLSYQVIARIIRQSSDS